MKKRYKVPLLFFCIITFLLLALFLFISQTKFVEIQVARYLSSLFDKKTPVKVTIGDINYSLWGELALKDMLVEYAEEGLEYTILDLRDLKLGFNIIDLLRKRWNFQYIEIHHPKIQLRQSKDGRILVPSWRKKKSTIERSSEFSVFFLLVKDGAFKWYGTTKNINLDSINLNLSANKDKDVISLSLLNGNILVGAAEGLRLKKISGKAKIKSDSLFLEKVKLFTANSKLEFKEGTVDLKPFYFSFDLTSYPFYLEDLYKIGSADLEGKLNLSGNIEGDLKRIKGSLVLDGILFDKDLKKLQTKFSYEKMKCTFYSLQGSAFHSPVQLIGELDLRQKPERYFLKGKVKNLNIANIVSTELWSDLSGDLEMKGEGFKEKDFKLDLVVDLESGKFEQYSFSRAKGKINISINELLFGENFKLWYKNTELMGVGRIGFADSLNLRGIATFKDLRDFTGQTFIRDIKGRGSFQFSATGPLSDFALEGRFESDSIWGYDLYSSNLKSYIEINKFISRRGVNIELLLSDGTVWGIPYDSITSVIEMEGDSITIEPTTLFSNSLFLTFNGNMDISGYPQNLTLEKTILDFQGNKVESVVPTRIEIDEVEVRFTDNKFKVGKGDFSITGKVDYNERMDLELDMKKIQILPWTRFLLPAKRIDGKLDAIFKLNGLFKKPELNLYSEIRDFNYENIDLGFFNGSLSYDGRKLYMDKISLLHPDGDYLLSGYVPLELSFSPITFRLQDEPQNIVLKGEGNKFSLINVLIPQVEYLQGAFKAGVIITGTPLHPEFEGSTEFSKGTLKLLPFRNTLTQVQAKIRMKNEILFIDEASGVASYEKISQENLLKKIWHFFFPKSKVKGKASLYGNINLGDIKNFKYDLYLSAKDLPLSYEYVDLVATTDLDLKISGQNPPLLSGEVVFSNLYFKDPFNALIQSRAGPPIPKENLWNLELGLRGANNLWVLNQDMQTEFKGEIQLSRRNGDLKLLGILETIRGKHFLYGTTFKIKKGEFIFDDIQKIDPKLDFLVTTSLNGSAYSSRDSVIHKEQELELVIGGTLSTPEITPAPGSPYSKEEIAELLTFHQSFSEAESGENSIFQYRLAGSLGEAYANRFIENLATRSIGVETFEIRPLEPGKFSLFESEVTVGKYLSDKIYFRYTRRLSEATGQEAGMEYHLGKRFYLEAYRDKKGLFHLGLNLYWEY